MEDEATEVTITLQELKREQKLASLNLHRILMLQYEVMQAHSPGSFIKPIFLET